MVDHKTRKYLNKQPVYRITSIIVVFVLFITGISLSLFLNGKIPWNNKMAADPRFYIIENKNTLYYQNFTDGRKLYSMDLEGNHNKKLCSDYVSNLLTDGEYIYYKNLNDEKFYRINLDGTNRKVLDKINGYNFDILNDWIYFSGEKGVFKVKKDGSQLIKLSDIPSSNITIFDGMVYFKTIYDNILYSIKLDGSNLSKVLNEPVYLYKISNGQIFFWRASDRKLYKIKTDRTEMKKVVDTPLSTGAFDIKDHMIYFISERETQGPALYKVQEDGYNRVKLSDLEATTIKVIGNWIYCYHPSFNGRLYKISLDGKTNIEILSNYHKSIWE